MGLRYTSFFAALFNYYKGRERKQERGTSKKDGREEKTRERRKDRIEEAETAVACHGLV